ncbi:hypothetical protein [Kribbella sp. CA-293567]|uniref:hypothetical protein n=1 Tax=Kribbella sp. CA-293567 TaxID=3002436 RepID=UPI0022DD61BC|nr:hypothetical protein [Kribbella sp. CA-293567]WBQ04468.1 hypothetical protein OX958_31460 [Kribbella sp. CA-293567]
MTMTAAEARQALQRLNDALEGPLRTSARREGLAWLAALHGEDLVRLDELARYRTIYDGPAISSRPDPTESTGLGAVLASLYYDGRLRERALPYLPGELAPVLLALRTTDHVPQIRTRARELLFTLPPALAAMEVLLVIRRRLYGKGLLDEYAKRLTEEQLSGLRAARFRDLRRWAYQRDLVNGTLTRAELEIGALDNDQWIRARCADALAQRADAGVAPGLLTSRYVETRMAGLLRLPDELLSVEQIGDALFDRSARVRELAQWRCRRRSGDPAKTYRDAALVADRIAVGRRIGLISGLFEVGEADDLPLIVRHLTDRGPRVRLAAVKAVTGWLDGAERAKLLGPLLLDASPKVVGAAAAALAALPRQVTAEFVEAAWASGQPWSRAGATRVEVAGGPWNALESILRLVADVDPHLSRQGRIRLANWFRSTPDGGQLPNEDQKVRLRRRMGEVTLDDATVRRLGFYARLWPLT